MAGVWAVPPGYDPNDDNLVPLPASMAPGVPSVFASAPSMPNVDPAAPVVQMAKPPAHGPQVFASAPDMPNVDPVSAPLKMVKPPTEGGVPQVFAPPPEPNVRPDTPVEGQLRDTNDELRSLQAKDAPYDYHQHGLLRNIGHVAAGIGNIAGDIVAPSVMTQIPGTYANREASENNLGQRLQSLEKQSTDEQQKTALTAYETQRPEIEQSKIDQKQQAVQDRITQAAAARGQKVSFDGDGVPTFTDNPELQAYHTEAAVALLHQANAQKAQIQSEIAQNHYVPGTPEYEEAQRKLAQVDRKIELAGGNLALRGKEFQAHAYGTVDGQELPGALHDENGNTVGTWNNANVKPTTTERDAAGRATTMVDLQKRIEQQLEDPDVQDYIGPGAGRLAELAGKAGFLPSKVAQLRNDLVSYGAFQAGLHPVRGIGALEYFDKVMGGLGQTPEELRGKLASNSGTAADVQQVGEMPTKEGQQRVRTAPNGPNVPKAGGNTAPKENTVKTNSAGDKVIFKNGKWGPA